MWNLTPWLGVSRFPCFGLWHWMVFVFVCQQDGFQEQYAQTGRFPSPIVSPPRRPWALINWLLWASLLLYPLGLLLAQLVSSGSPLTIAASVAVCTAGWFLAFKPGGVVAIPSLDLTGSFLSKCSIKQQIWQLKCKSFIFGSVFFHCFFMIYKPWS